MRLLADQAAIAIRQSQLYREGDRRRREAEVVAELASKINASLELREILERVVEGARDLCRADSSRIAVRTPDDPSVRFRHTVGTQYAGYLGTVIEPGKGLGGGVLATGESFRTDDYAVDSRFTRDYLHHARAEGNVTEMAVPIRSHDELHGVLYVSNRSPRPFTDNDEAVLRRLADQRGGGHRQRQPLPGAARGARAARAQPGDARPGTSACARSARWLPASPTTSTTCWA